MSSRGHNSNTDIKDLMGRVIHLTGSIDERMIQHKIEAVFGFAADGDDPILLVINSYGGSISDMLALHDTLMMVPCPIYTFVVGRAYSAAAVLAIIGEPGRRFIMPHATMMIHPLKSGCRGGVDEMKAHVERSSEMQDRIEQMLLDASDLKRKQMRRMMKNEIVLGAQEAVQSGMVDAVIADINTIGANG